MEWLNYHHLRYFWTVARKGGVRKAAEDLHVSQPSISAQLRLLEESLGQKLFWRSGRNLVLTETGQLVLDYTDEIFSAGRELMNAVKQRPGKHPVRVNIGLTDAFPKLIAFQILRTAFRSEAAVHMICREGEIGPLVSHLQAHRLDIVLADEPASSALKAKTFNHRLGRSGITFCAAARRWRQSCDATSRSRSMAPQRCCRRRTWECAPRWRPGSTRKRFARV